MNSDFVIDTYAWVEYFAGSDAGGKVRSFVEGQNCATPTIVVAELSRKLLKEIRHSRETEEGRLQKLTFVASSSDVTALNGDLATKAGELDVERRLLVKDWGLADSIVLATARECGARVVTGDRHFRDLKDEVIFVPASRA
ncbi:MAG: type II toxin-antitoxin system VapC family toxin [Nitrososphaerota archaeon]|jgi:predicted nucleic acid-binding protein|nr:type II toxin-antitoxin system VapC family toxin [Nitrososphaerota archaeon]MDG6960204.1 type II toxin-antitoxin system VapC family toxin [Nitrososphaerota archaeon]MDG6968334.1 type II toxin-antitoxin system VapC family toxin [Nitrososphaerota archaeon]MDG6980775.1 type II toxin-antitoxin system VapC family toxin [Nitrososphaerota archaeon]MDG7014850.1 type II toxin-antitoxin system VapC family toxin [Nitrososphaerota archaeon]